MDSDQGIVCTRRYWEWTSDLAFLLIFGLAFLYQAREQLGKYLDGETATLGWTSRDAALHFPALTLCPQPGFDRRAFELSGLRVDHWDVMDYMPREDGDELEWSRVPASKEVADGWWNETTWALDDFLISVRLWDGAKPKIADERLMGTRRLESFILGACYALNFSAEVSGISHYVSLYFDLPGGMDRVNVYLSQDGAQDMGLQVDLWLAPYHTLEIRPNEVSTVGVTKSVRYLDHSRNSCAESTGMADYIACLKTKSVQLVKNHTAAYHGSNNKTINDMVDRHETANDRPFCYMPGIKDWTGHLDSVCGNFSSYFLSCWALPTLVMNEALPLCPSPCDSERYSVTVNPMTISPFFPRRGARMWLHYTDVQVPHDRDVVLYDLGAIVCSVGGSMGLFLGFSFYRTATWVAAAAAKTTRRKWKAVQEQNTLE